MKGTVSEGGSSSIDEEGREGNGLLVVLWLLLRLIELLLIVCHLKHRPSIRLKRTDTFDTLSTISGGYLRLSKWRMRLFKLRTALFISKELFSLNKIAIHHPCYPLSRWARTNVWSTSTNQKVNTVKRRLTNSCKFSLHIWVDLPWKNSLYFECSDCFGSSEMRRTIF